MDLMNVKTCERCGGLYETFLETNVCSRCYAILEDKLKSIKTYIQANRTADITEVCETMKIDEKQVMAWIREGRLKFPSESGVTVPCMKCGTEMRYGKYCGICRKDMIDELESVYDKPSVQQRGSYAVKKGSHMHFLGREHHRKGRR